MNSLQGYMLIAVPELMDSNFFQTVVLIVRHDEEGALGLVVNRSSRYTVREVWEQVSGTPIETHDPVFVGGPVQGPLMALHTQPTIAELEVAPSICYSVQSQQLEQLVSLNPGPMKFFLGFAGWAAGQLEEELREGVWLTMLATQDHVFTPAEDLWRRLVREARNPILAALNIQNVPSDPSLN